MLLHPMTQVSPGGSIFPGDPGLGCAIFEKCCDFHLVRIQFAFPYAFEATQRHPLHLACGKRFRGPL